jgi:transcriptional regulator with XRE-family HTH domain
MSSRTEAHQHREHADRLGLGERLRELRTERGMTLADLAERTGISISFLAHVEKGKSDIGVSRLRRIVDAYGMTMVDLFPPDNAEPDVVRASELRQPPDTDGVHVYLLTAAPQRTIQPLLVEWEPGATMEYHPEEGEEFLHMLQGTLRIAMATGEVLVVKRGDSVYLARSTVREYTNVGTSTARNISVLVPVKSAGAQ